MEDNLKIILGEFEKLKGQFIINHNRVERFIAVATDEEDYYYVTYDGRKCSWTSCLMGLVPLKGKIDDKHYDEFIRLAKINHFDQPNIHNHNPDDLITEGFILNTKAVLYQGKPISYRDWANMNRKDIEQVELPNKFLTEVCWDLN